jgi:hypothetical protein
VVVVVVVAVVVVRRASDANKESPSSVISWGKLLFSQNRNDEGF